MFDQLALHTKAVSDPLRLELLRVLGRGSFGVLELCDVMQVKQSRLSHHLKVLTSAALVSPQREGNSIFYRRALIGPEHPWHELTEALFASLDKIALRTAVVERIERIHQERAAQSQAFFDKHALEFRQRQDLIASHEQYGATLKKIIATLKAQGAALEVGPGEGALLESLAGTFKLVSAYEVSSAMHQQCQARLERMATPTEHVELHLGDVFTSPMTARPFDLISCNMVMHHLAAPQELFALSAEHLSADGVLLVCDLCAHDQDWAKASCGDIWLGFEPSQLKRWASAHGLFNVQSQFLALRNGFEVQFQLYQRLETEETP